ncbi:MAG: YggS family pyridoxal phosphate-dependent enzyme [Pseudomonadota bacterium]|nr:MAG: YggS family pyridoxal phosphate-dependent enzyme [Pseudomonadota bacterium]
MTLIENFRAIEARIARAAQSAGRDSRAVRLIAVSKGHPAAAIRELYAAGQRDFGESYAQELEGKAAELAELTDLRWHMIGHLQRNKARSVVRHVTTVHSVDSIALARELGRRAQAIAEERARRFGPEHARLDVLVEVSIAGEEQKGGVAKDALAELLAAVEAEPALRLVGLMCIPPLVDDPAAARPYFDELAALRDAHGGPERLPELSMGMTHDFEQAIAAGATIVRVGTAIFGERPPRRA